MYDPSEHLLAVETSAMWHSYDQNLVKLYNKKNNSCRATKTPNMWNIKETFFLSKVLD